MKLELDYVDGQFEYQLRLEVPAASDMVDPDPLDMSLSELTISRAFLIALVRAYRKGEWTEEEAVVLEWGNK